MKTNPIAMKKPKLIIEIAIVITCKLLFIFGLWYFFFSPDHRPEVTSDIVGSVILGSQTTSTTPNPTK